MVKNTQSSTSRQIPHEWLVITALTAICSQQKQTFSWYASKKGRVWLQFKGYHGAQYTTAAECTAPYTDERTLDTFAILLASHLPKVLEIAPPVTSWHSGSHTGSEVAEAWERCTSLFAELASTLVDGDQVANDLDESEEGTD